MESVHGHDVMHFMLENEGAFNKTTLIEAIEGKWGEACRFHTCSSNEMTAAELVEFLEARGKFVGTEDAFQTAENKICKH